MKNKKTIRGFTLIELLVSISIVAVLTALLTVNFIGARQRGRDGQRKANLYQLQSSLELYRADNGKYPPDSALAACGIPLTSAGGTVYMQEIPCDPSSAGGPFGYTAAPASCDNVSVSCLTYTLFGCLENPEDSEKDNPKNANCTDASFTLTNP
ncbi:MAG: type II secretion system protein [Candidatus Levybacteria bacterium]|nr:type II secretion system protein [Candidatus Levybacteria bacterium]